MTSPEPSTEVAAETPPATGWAKSRQVPIIIGAIALTVIVVGAFMVIRARSQVNRVALASQPKDVTVITAKAGQYRPVHKYVGTLEPWVQAKLGPQFISAFVDTVLVRPGDVVQRGQVVATLDCRHASASNRAVSLQARALQTQQKALAHEASRIAELQHGGFASPNEIEQKEAESIAKQADLESTQAKLQRATLEVSDCILRAPFPGEIATRSTDPGAFVHPGDPVATLVDRDTVRVTVEVPEIDFDYVGPGTPVRIRALANDRELTGTIARRSPAADSSTRTVHFEIDVPDPNRQLPVGTTADLTIDAGEPTPATLVPLVAASVRGPQATLFTVQGGIAHKVNFQVKGEQGETLFVDSTLPAGTEIVTEGRALLEDGDPVRAVHEKIVAATPSRALAPKGVHL
ncbi:MAG: efflux RND transporter periplasmic adaptor subunit [Polyangia bacterium]|jgi:RND family efflux transporter MFP subunit